MNKKDIANIRKQFKVDNDRLAIQEIFHAYILKESSEIYHEQIMPFEMLDRDQQELFMQNFKKLLTGKPDEKQFELAFDRDAENNSQLILHQGLLAPSSDEWKAKMLEMVEKILASKQYDMDIVITFIRGEYRQPQKRNNDDTDESEQNTVYANSFTLCSINQTEQPERKLSFDYLEKAFNYHVAVDPIINLKAPIGGFLFPCFTDNAADVNHVLFTAAKPDKLDPDFIENVLTAEEAITAQEDKYTFEEIVKDVTDDQLNTSTLAHVYEEINQVVESNEDEEPPTLGREEIENVLKASGVQDVSTEKVETAFRNVTDDENYQLKATNIMPKYDTKSIKIDTKVAKISISPQDLQYVRQVDFNGKRCLLIEVEENTVIDGFTMLPENLQKAQLNTDEQEQSESIDT